MPPSSRAGSARQLFRALGRQADETDHRADDQFDRDEGQAAQGDDCEQHGGVADAQITKLKPVGGFCAETAAALTLAYVTLTGTPVSTTHTITGSIVGVGATRRLSAVKWGVAGRIVWAWVLTIPAAALMAAISYWIVATIHRLAQ